MQLNRLVGADSRCAGTLEVKHQGEWRPVWGFDSFRTLKEAQDSVRLLDGTSLCSGRLEVKSDESNPSWSSVCEADFDQQDAEVVCRDLDCGAPSVLQGAPYEEKEAPMSTKEFQCGGHESALLDCRSSGSDRNTCSPGRAVSLTCSGCVGLVGADSRCAGTLEVKHQSDWRPVVPLTQKTADAACRELDCGSAVSVGRREESSDRSVWKIRSDCVQSGSSLRECSTPSNSNYFMNLTCSDLLFQPNISLSSSMDRVSEAQQQGFQMIRGSTFTISCSIQPQYPGGSFQLNFTSSSLAHNHNSKPAVNHSAHFLFPSVEPAHQGSYSCVYKPPGSYVYKKSSTRCHTSADWTGISRTSQDFLAVGRPVIVHLPHTAPPSTPVSP
nr:scavenger receptor cysteine-rich type 1 protein M130-like [Pseudochaenichthys georgianus]